MTIYKRSRLQQRPSTFPDPPPQCLSVYSRHKISTSTFVPTKASTELSLQSQYSKTSNGTDHDADLVGVSSAGEDSLAGSGASGASGLRGPGAVGDNEGVGVVAARLGRDALQDGCG